MKELVLDTLNTLQLLRSDHSDARRLSIAQSGKSSPEPVTPEAVHLKRGIEWIKRAQDAMKDGGVSWGYCGRVRWRSPATLGWRSSYPETTGYIIETMIRFGKRYGDPDAIQRARTMTDWEVKIQLPDGGIQGGRVDATPVSSSTFVTGQVMFGWLAAYREFGDERYLQAARRAGDFLLSCLDDQGRFVKGYSHFCEPGPKAYEARTGWAIALLGQVTGEARYMDAAREMSRYALRCRRANGWFEQNDLDTHDRPLTHTIGYVLEGVLETGLLTGEPSFTEAVADSVDKIRPLVRDNGFLAGRWTQDWKPAADWSCLTGSSQIAIVCLRLNQLSPRREWREMAHKLLGMVSATQLVEGYDPGLLGGIHGSYPFDGGYCQFCLPNWATKFYADAMMLYLDPQAAA